MKVLLLFAAVLVANGAYSSPIDQNDEDLLSRERQLYPKFITMPDGDSNPVRVDLEAPVNREILEQIERNPSNNDYWLYTRSNSRISQTLTFNNAASVRNSNFDANKQTIIIAHGWLSTGLTEPNPSVRNAYLDKHDVNVITVDWRRLSLSDYATAALGVPAVGRGVGQFINWLNSEFGLRYENVHLVGFSLGAHLVGNAGRETGGRVARVTGLDPAGPLWNYNSNRISSNDGVYVEAIHTDGGYTVDGLGIGSALVQVDFFPNGGISQPGCMTNICNHNRAWELFAATITYNHLSGRRCTSNLQITLNTCRGNPLNMGNDDLRKTGSGSYRLNTDRRYPY